MGLHRTPEQLRQHYVEKMGPELGLVFHRLFNDNAWLHMKWNEFVKLFARTPEQIATLNAAARGFFVQVRDLWWDDLLLHISRMTDNRTDVLSVYSLVRYAPVGLRPEISKRIDGVGSAVAFARDARNRNIAHRNIDLALQRALTPLNLGSRNDVRVALKSLDELLHFVEHHFCGSPPTFYDAIEPLGGVDSLVDVIERGVRDRERQFGSEG